MYFEDKSNVEVNKVTFENGNSNGQGGAIFIYPRSLATFKGCKFIGNSSTDVQIQGGGAIGIRAFSEALFENCEFRDNFTTRSNGGAIANVLSVLTINNCKFYNNKSVSTLVEDNIVGGAIYVDGARYNNGKITITNSLFDGNESNQGGGVSFFMYNQQEVIMKGCIIRNNKAVGPLGYGGGFRMVSGSKTEFGDPGFPMTPGGNTKLTMENTVIHDNSATYQGGGLLLAHGNSIGVITNCTIVNNRAAQADGNGAAGGGFFINTMKTTLNHCTIARNYAGSLGGGISNGVEPFDITLNNCILAYNVANNNGSGKTRRKNCRNVYKGDGNIEFPAPNNADALDGRCTQNIPQFIDPKLGQLSNNGGLTATVPLLAGSPAIDADFGLVPAYTPTDQRGVAMEDIPGVGEGAPKIRDIGAYEFSTAPPPGNAGAGSLAAITSSQTQINLTWADEATGEIEFEIQRSKNNIFNFATINAVGSDVELFNNAGLEPNVVYYYRVRAVYSDSTSDWSNIAGAVTLTNGACDNAGYKPSVMPSPDVVVGDGTLASCSQEALQAALDAGGLIMCNCGTTPATIMLNATLNISVNNTVFDGGGLVTLSGENNLRVLNVDEGIDFTLQNIKIIKGKAPATGGLFNESGGAMLIGSGITGDGGGIIQVINSTFEDNTLSNTNVTERGGGAIYTYSLENLIISGCSFKNNSANVGGAIAGIGSQLTVINSSFQNNQAIGDGTLLNGVGGAIYADGIDLWDDAPAQEHTLTICGTTFTGNEANHEGGAVYSAISDSKRNKVVIDKSSFENNRLTNTNKGNGGAIFHIEDDYVGNTNDPALNLSITNSTFAGNTCKGQGGAIWTIVGGNVDMLNTTFHANSVTKTAGSLGGAIAISSAGYGGTYNIRNITFADNTSAHFAGAVFASTSNTVNVNTCIFSENTSDFEFEGHQLAGNAAFAGNKNILYPPKRWNGSDDDFPVDTTANRNPYLQPLGFYGGFTKTMALTDSSLVAINTGNNTPATDQRGLAKIGLRDVGAFEFGAVLPNVPMIVSFSPLSANLGATITVIGSGFTGTTQVAFNGVPATVFTVLSSTQISVQVPNAATTGKVSVSTPLGVAFSLEDFIVNIPLPSVASFAPTFGERGTVVTVIGTGLLSTTAVSIGGRTAPVFTVQNNTTVKVTVPDNALTGVISITTNGGTTSTSGLTPEDFTVTPSVNNFNPTLGKDGDIVIIRGTNFTSVSGVEFDGVPAGFTLDSDTQITATVPVTSTGKIGVIIGGITYLSTDDFVFVLPPTLTNFSPTAGRDKTIVTLTGTNLSTVLGIKFNDVDANSISIINDNTLEVAVPNSSTNGVISVITPGGTVTTASIAPELTPGNIFTVRPSISHFTPVFGGSGSPGTIVKIMGTNLVKAGQTSIYFGRPGAGGVRAAAADVPPGIDPFDNTGNEYFYNSAGQEIRVTVPVGASGVNEIFFVSDNSDAGTPTDSISKFFTVIGTPVIANHTPIIGADGVGITINGSNFGDVTEVLIGGVATTDFNINGTGDQITLQLPDNAKSGLVQVRNPSGTSTSPTNSGNFTVIPSIANFTPTSGRLGQQVTINGANFSDVDEVTFYDGEVIRTLALTQFTIVNPTRIRVNTPAPTVLTIGKIGVNTTDGQGAVSPNNFTFIPAPVITSFTPLTDIPTATVTITGTNFTGASAVTFNGVTAPAFMVVNATTITVTVPVDATTGKVSVTTPGGTTVSTDDFVVIPNTPVITAFNPTSGAVGTVVNITGNHLSTTSAVTFNGTPVVTFNVISNTQISAVVPIGAADGQIALTTNFGNANTAGLATPNFDVITALPPTITGFTPTSGGVGTVVTINGTNFNGATTEVRFNGVLVTDFTVNNNQKITATVPIGTNATGFITVTVDGNTVSSSSIAPPTPQVFTIIDAWNGSVSNDWNNTANWNLGVVPTNSNTTDINIGVVPNNHFYPTIAAASVTLRNITIANSASLTVANGATLDINGTITNNGTFAANGTLIFSGSSGRQDLPASITSYKDITVDNPNNIRLLANISVSGVINFINGHLQLNGKEINLGSTGSLANETNAHGIRGNNGSIVATLTGSSDFLETGVNIANLGAVVTIPDKPGLAGITIRRGHTPQTDGIDVGIKRYYVINPAGVTTGLNATLEFAYFDNELTVTPVISEIDLVLFRFDGVDWSTRVPMADLLNNKLTLTGIDQFSTWTAGSASAPLPVRWLSIDANRIADKAVEIEWQVMADETIVSFEVLKNESGAGFQKIGELDGVAQNRTAQNFTFIDPNALTDALYQIRQTTADGKTSLSPPVFVAGMQQEVLRIYPNPTLQSAYLSLPTQGAVRLQVLTGQGRLVMEYTGELAAAESLLNKQLPAMTSGLYLIQVQSAGKTYQAKLMKQ
jgi:hypothetical protein